MKRIIITAILMAITIGVHAQSNVVEVEYFLDSDLGFGMNSVLAISSPDIDVTEAVLADIPVTTSIGYHKLYIRTKDADGNWSHTTRKHIEVFSSVTENNVVLGEYFIDEDPQFGIANTFVINPETTDIEQAFDAEIQANVPLGYHKLYGRVKDTNGNWSHTFRKNIEVYLNPDTNVIEIEYFFVDDSDLGFGNNPNIVTIETPEVEGEWTFMVDYPEGPYNFDDKLFVRVKGSDQRWSHTTVLDEILLSVGNSLYNSITVSPNPFSNQIEINTSRAMVIDQVTVYDITGKQVYKRSEDLRTIDLSHLNNGLYLLNIKTESEQATFKLVKQ